MFASDLILPSGTARSLSKTSADTDDMSTAIAASDKAPLCARETFIVIPLTMRGSK
jgi:hypothetical protein